MLDQLLILEIGILYPTNLDNQINGRLMVTLLEISAYIINNNLSW
jgi:hypothetical protein